MRENELPTVDFSTDDLGYDFVIIDIPEDAAWMPKNEPKEPYQPKEE